MRQWLLYLLLMCVTTAITVVAYRHAHAEWVVFRQAESLFSKQNYEQAIPLYQQAIRDGLVNRDAFRHLAECHEQNGTLDDAIALYESFAKTDVNDFWLQLELGGLYARHQRFESAVKTYRYALTLEPQNRTARIFLARSLTAVRMFDEAADEYKILLGETHDSK